MTGQSRRHLRLNPSALLCGEQAAEAGRVAISRRQPSLKAVAAVAAAVITNAHFSQPISVLPRVSQSATAARVEHQEQRVRRATMVRRVRLRHSELRRYSLRAAEAAVAVGLSQEWQPAAAEAAELLHQGQRHREPQRA